MFALAVASDQVSEISYQLVFLKNYWALEPEKEKKCFSFTDSGYQEQTE